MFHPLGREHIRAIVDIQLGYLRKRLAERDIGLELDDAARDQLGEAGFDPVYGARPLKRAIQQQLENPLAQRILRGEFGPGDAIRVTARDGALRFRSAQPAIADGRCPPGRLRPCRSTNTSAQACGYHHEALQKITDPPLRKCPECGKHALKRLISAPVFRLTGSGWYETDFKSDKEEKRNLATRRLARKAKPRREAPQKPATRPKPAATSRTRGGESGANAKAGRSKKALEAAAAASKPAGESGRNAPAKTEAAAASKAPPARARPGRGR